MFVALGGGGGAERHAEVVDLDEAGSTRFQSQTKLRLCRPVNAVAGALVVPDRAAGDFRLFGQIALRPAEEASRGAAHLRRQKL